MCWAQGGAAQPHGTFGWFGLEGMPQHPDRGKAELGITCFVCSNSFIISIIIFLLDLVLLICIPSHEF